MRRLRDDLGELEYGLDPELSADCGRPGKKVQTRLKRYDRPAVPFGRGPASIFSTNKRQDTTSRCWPDVRQQQSRGPGAIRGLSFYGAARKPGSI